MSNPFEDLEKKHFTEGELKKLHRTGEEIAQDWKRANTFAESCAAFANNIKATAHPQPDGTVLMVNHPDVPTVDPFEEQRKLQIRERVAQAEKDVQDLEAGKKLFIAAAILLFFSSAMIGSGLTLLVLKLMEKR